MFRIESGADDGHATCVYRARIWQPIGLDMDHGTQVDLYRRLSGSENLMHRTQILFLCCIIGVGTQACEAAGPQGTRDVNLLDLGEDDTAPSEPDVNDVVPSDGAPLPSPRIGLDPPDLTSNVGSAPIRLVLSATGAEIDPDDVGAFQDAVSMVDEAGTPIAFTIHVTQEPTGMVGPGSRRTFLELETSDSLPAGWSRVSLAALPQGWKPMTLTWTPRPDDDVGLSGRVASNDAPVLRMITVCWSASKLAVLLDFSQSIVLRENLTPSVLLFADNSPCTMAPGVERAPDAYFACQGNAMPESIYVDLQGAKSTLGTQVHAALGSSETAIDVGADLFETGSPEGDSCRMYRF